MKVEIEDDQCAGCEFNGDGRISREQQGRRSEQRIPNLDGAPETISSKRNERDGTHTKPPVKSTNLIDILIEHVMSDFFDEVQRRTTYRVAAAYFISAGFIGIRVT